MRKKGEVIELSQTSVGRFFIEEILRVNEISEKITAMETIFGKPSEARSLIPKKGGGFIFGDKKGKPLKEEVSISEEEGVEYISLGHYKDNLEQTIKQAIHNFIVKEDCQWMLDTEIFKITITELPVDIALLNADITSSQEN